MLQRDPSPASSGPSRSAPAPASTRVAIVASEYNRKHVDGLLDAAIRVLREAGAAYEIFRVPGAFEIPVVAASLASRTTRRYSALIGLGVIIRGETAHADLVASAVTSALMDLSVRYQVPVIHEVLLVAHRGQADVRCLDERHNRGSEAARTALAMVRILRRTIVTDEDESDWRAWVREKEGAAGRNESVAGGTEGGRRRGRRSGRGRRRGRKGGEGAGKPA